MALTGSTRGYFVVWTQSDFLVELINFDKERWEKIYTNLEVFFKQYLVKALLNIEPLTYCGKCGVLLNENEISENEEKERNICCDNCNSNFHYGCQGLKSTPTNDIWLYLVCLTNLPEVTE